MSDVIRYLEPGETLIKEGEESADLYWILEGELIVTKKIKDRIVVELGKIKSGELVGEMAFLDQQPRSATVKAVEKCKIMTLHYDDFSNMIEAQPKWMKKIFQTLCNRIRAANEL